MKRLAIIGSAFGGGAGQIIEAIQGNNDLSPVLILDNDVHTHGKNVFGVSIIGPTTKLLNYWEEKLFDSAIIAIGGDLKEREKVFNFLLENNIEVANIIDQTVKFGLNITMGVGNVILNSTYIGNNVNLGDNNYILNQCSVQHDSKIGCHNYMATNVSIGARVLIGNFNRFKMKCIIETGAHLKDMNTIDSNNVVNI